jgi:PleD family two-component response regulator
MAQKNVGAYCYRVKGLFVPYQTPASIDNDINNYISKIGKYTERLEDYFNRKDTNGFISTLEAIHAMLQAVYAKQCISYTSALLDGARTRSLDYCHQLLQQAVADLLLLSIEMQKAQKLDTSPAIKYKHVERNEEIARGLSAISRLISVRDYEKALSMACDMKNMEDVFAKLEGMLKSQEYDRAGKLASTAEKEHIGIIQRVGATAANTLKTVLAVDDRPEILTNVNAALRGHYRVLGAPGGRMALEIMSRQKIDLFYLDIDMPEIDGFELAGRIRADRAYEKTPIIFLTGNASRENIERGISLGISDFVVKPSNHINLLVKARMYMDGQ